MAKETKEGLTVTKSGDSSEWYQQVVQKAGLADYSPVKGCMIIRPHGYAMWEGIQSFFDGIMKGHGVQNAYFPLFIPESFFKKEATHAEGFSPEVAWIENKDKDMKDRLAIRPTSETIMYDSYARWIRSWRDLPFQMNQWANVVRWETKATKPFLRTREFLWQEGHCVYATAKECAKETKYWSDMYKKVSEELLAIPVLQGKKTESEKFSGADYTVTIEAIMPDGKALQMGTSHNLGQGFAKAFGISYLDEQGKKQVPYQNSWGISTRMIGAIILAHGDDKGLVLPPRIAPITCAIVPIFFDKKKKVVMKGAEALYKKLLNTQRVVLDGREQQSAGWRFSEWELKGVPLRIEIGPKDVEKKQVVLVRRDTGKKEFVKVAQVEKRCVALLEEMQKNLLSKAKKNLKDRLVKVTTKQTFTKAIKDSNVAIISCCATSSCEDAIKEATGATSRCIIKEARGKCVYCGKKAAHEVYYSKSY